MKETNKFLLFIKNKGFYLVLALCVIAAAFIAYVSVNSTIEKMVEPQKTPLEIKDHENTYQPPEKEKITAKPQEEVKKPDDKITEPTPPPQEPTTTITSAPKVADFVMPVNGEIINDYSNGELVKSKTLNHWRTHDAVDIAGDILTPVKASSDGVVKEVYYDELWGHVVEILHSSDIISIYASLDKDISVKQGDKVKIGQTIGKIGDSATAEIKDEPHLHFAMKKGGSYIDPKVMIEK